MDRSTTRVTHTNKAQSKELVIFIFACVILIATLVFLALPTGISYNGDANDAEEQVPGGLVVAVLAGAYVTMVVGLIMGAIVIICWIIGLILSVKLVLRRKQIPRWMHISSLVLTLLYLAFFLTLILVWVF